MVEQKGFEPSTRPQKTQVNKGFCPRECFQKWLTRYSLPLGGQTQENAHDIDEAAEGTGQVFGSGAYGVTRCKHMSSRNSLQKGPWELDEFFEAT